MNTATLKWQSKLERSDYELVKLLFGFRINDHRNKRSYLIPAEVMAQILIKHNTYVTPDHIIDHCINTAFIPHPYDELL